MRKKRIMVIGSRKSGKTSLINYLNGTKDMFRSSPYMKYEKNTIDVPGQYLESPWMHIHIIAAQQDAYCVIMISDPLSKKTNYPPGFSKAFRIQVLGVISKVDIKEANIDFSKRELELAGVKEPFYFISTRKKKGIYALEKVLDEIKNKTKGGEKDGVFIQYKNYSR